MALMLEPWIRRIVLDAKKLPLCTHPARHGGGRAQVIQFHTFRDAEHPERPIEATISDKYHTITVNFDVSATNDFEAKRGSLTSLTGQIFIIRCCEIRSIPDGGSLCYLNVLAWDLVGGSPNSGALGEPVPITSDSQVTVHMVNLLNQRNEFRKTRRAQKAKKRKRKFLTDAEPAFLVLPEFQGYTMRPITDRDRRIPPSQAEELTRIESTANLIEVPGDDESLCSVRTRPNMCAPLDSPGPSVVIALLSDDEAKSAVSMRTAASSVFDD